MESLVVTPISRASAAQRAGRAGRVSPGKCYRLYTLDSFEREMKEVQTPEIQRINLCNVVLLLKSLGIDDLVHFDYMDPPPTDTLIQALTQLYSLGALDDSGALTKLGRRMAELPIDPLLAKMILASEAHSCTNEILTIASMLSVGDAIFYRPKAKAAVADEIHKSLWNEHGDHLTLLRVYQDWESHEYSPEYATSNFIQVRALNRARDIRKQLVRLCKRVDLEMKSSTDELRIRRAITSGFFLHTAVLDRDGSYRTYKGRMVVHIHPSSSLFRNPPRALIYHELVLTKKEFMRHVTAIDIRWLSELAPQFAQTIVSNKK
jgi:pre-mRNA-splicing factor ATP-dependent RNA helicase DHX16